MRALAIVALAMSLAAPGAANGAEGPCREDHTPLPDSVIDQVQKIDDVLASLREIKA